MRAMLAKNDIDGLREAAQRIAGADGLAIHYVALHGDLLALRCERRPLIAYYIVRRDLPGGSFIDVLSIPPIGVPAIVLSVGFLWAYLWFPIGIYATMWAMFLALTTGPGVRLQQRLAANPQRLATVTAAALLIGGAFLIVYWGVRLPAAFGYGWFPKMPWH